MASQGYDWKTAEPRWQEAWEAAKIFQARADPSRPKYFITTPYPYVNGLVHLGQGATYLHTDIMARYQRMRGLNVLFPFAFHATGLPILGAADRTKEGEPEQLAILEGMGIPEGEVAQFADPLHWIRVFPEETQSDLRAFGFGVDWSRTFITTDQNPAYDAFVKWQFRRLKAGDYVRLGKHPVIWCPKDAAPIGDHDRSTGEGEVPVEFTLLKFQLRDRWVVTATLRPETVFGTTNVWVDPDVEYVEALVDGERWLINEPSTTKLADQGKSVEVLGRVAGEHLVGQSCIVPLVGDPVPILPTQFIDQDIGTGIVSSVPSDAPDDLVALRELQEDVEGMARFQLDVPFVQSLDPIPIIDVEGFGPLPAQDVVQRRGITSQQDREPLERAKEEVYRTEYYSGVMGKRSGEFAGMAVEEAKERVKAAVIERGEADHLYEPSGPVVCRCLTRAIVRVVEDQWFLAYGDPQWKAQVHEALEGMGLFPEAIRKQFHQVIDWLRDWACTHHQGLGTKLPWDDNWVIESLSDSTIYMAYYTIEHLLRELDPGTFTDALFDYVFQGTGDVKAVAAALHVRPARVEEMRREFTYWYPVDLRQSGKDLVPNHFTFCLFNHVALFPEAEWPRAFGVNGYLSVKTGVKMSKSQKGAVYLRDSVQRWGADATRLTLIQGGEGLDDPTFDEDFAEHVGSRIAALLEWAQNPGETVAEAGHIDAWFRSVLHAAIGEAARAMEAMYQRTALKHAFFDLQRNWAWYLRRIGGRPAKAVLQEFLEVQTRLLAPFAPHVAEELWHALGHEDFVATADYPQMKEDALDPRAETLEAYLKGLVDDVRQILKAIDLTPSRVVLYTASPWKREVYDQAVHLRLKDRLDMGALIEGARKLPGTSGREKAVAAFSKRLAQQLAHRGQRELESVAWTFDEREFLQAASPFLEAELQAQVAIFDEDDVSVDDPASKATTATPWRPAVYVE